MTMFTALAGLAARASLHIMIVGEGDKLRITLQPKPTGEKGTVPPPLQLIGTPEELDREFVASITEYQAPAISVLEQAKAQAKAIAEKPAQKAAPAPKAVTKGATRPTVKKAMKKAAAPKTKAAPKAKAKPAASTARKPRKDALTLEELMDMAREYVGKLGDKKPSRAGFIKKHPKGRRYERLFKGGFNELMDAARRQELPIEPEEIGRAHV
jgi:PRTRC genetic system protein E